MLSDAIICFSANLLAITSVWNQHEPRVTGLKGVFLLTLGFLYFIKLTDFLNKFFLETRLGQIFRKRYSLAVDKVLDINNKLISLLQAALSAGTGFFMCTFSCIRGDFLFTSHFVSQAYAYFGAGFFIYDIWSMYRVHISELIETMKKKLGSAQPMIVPIDCSKDIPSIQNGQLSIFKSTSKDLPSFLHYMFVTNPLMVIHHLFIGLYGLAVMICLRGNLGDCMFSFVYIMETSTPFVSLRGILHTMGLKQTRLYLINGMLMVFTFFIFRVLILPYGIYCYSEYANISLLEALHRLPRHCKISVSLIFILQIYWFKLIVKGAIKLLKASPGAHQKQCLQQKVQ